jgi:hypothetical protein
MGGEQEFSASAVATVTPPATVEEETQADA